MQVVIADDEPITRMDLKEILEKEGHQVVAEAADGFDAIECCRNCHPDLVVMDVKMPLLDGITLSGGEPFCQPEPLAELARLVHGMGKDVTVFTGWTYEQLLEKNDPGVNALLAETDVLIDGPFVLEQRNLELRFRGSENQRLINMRETRKQGRVVLVQEE